MKKDYFCPKCEKSVFNSMRNRITLKGVLKGDFFSITSDIELSDQVGEFGGEFLNKGIDMEPGAVVDFHCPHCNWDLTAEFDAELSELVYLNDRGEESTFIISNIAGKEMSFLIDKDQKKIKESYGKSREEYLRDTTNYLSMYSKF